VGDVRAAAQVDELALAVEAQAGILLEVVVDVLDLVSLIEVLDQAARLRGGPLEALEGLGGGDDLAHLLLDAREVLLAQRRVAVDVVIEAVLDGGAEGQLDAGEETHDRPGHDVGAGMAQDVEGLAVAVGEDLEGHLA